MAKQNIAAAVREMIAPLAEPLGLSVWDVTFQKEGPDWYLTIFIDKEGGVGIDDCEAMSRAADPVLDEMDPTDHPYCLVVSSPGIGRTLKTGAHLAAYTGKKISVRLIRPDDTGKRCVSGILTEYDEDSITLAEGRTIQRKDAAHIKAADDEDLEELLK